jgi:hypothetical protein
LTAGLSNGAVQIIDCSTAKVVSTISKRKSFILFAIGQIGGGGAHGKILSIVHLNKGNQALISSEDQYVLYDFNSKSIVETIVSKKKSSGQAIPNLIDISQDDVYTIESSS